MGKLKEQFELFHRALATLEEAVSLPFSVIVRDDAAAKSMIFVINRVHIVVFGSYLPLYVVQTGCPHHNF